jgi:hypothetical protein
MKFSWSQTSQSIEDNTTTISWKLELMTGNGAIYKNSRAWSVTINGTKYSGTVRVNINTNSTQTLASGTAVIPHNNDGTKTLTYSFTQQFDMTLDNGQWLGTYSGSGSGVLNTIPRASQPSCITWPEHTQNVGEFGDEISIHMNRKSSVMTHTVRYQFGEQSGTIATGVTTGTKWVIPLTLMNLIPNSTSGSGTIYVDTYNGSTKIGTKSCGFTATVPTSVKPSLSVALEDITGIDDIYGSPVKGLSKIKVTPTAGIAYSSPIASYAINANGVTYNTSTATTGVLTTSGDSVVTVTVKDKRGRTATWSYTMKVQAYTAPTIPMLTVRRCDSNGVENDQGECVEVLFSGQVSPMNDKNTATYSVRYKKSSDDNWTDLVEDVNGWKPSDLKDNFNVYNFSLVFVADGNSSYDVEVSATDRHNTTTRATSVSTAFTLYNCHPSGTGWRFGGVAEEEYTLQNDLNFIQRGNQYSFSSDGTSATNGFILMAQITITGSNADTPMTFVFSQRGATAPMTVHVCFKAVSNNDPELSSILYEGDNYDAYLTSQTESVWNLYVKKRNNYDTVTLNRWHTSKRQMNLVTVNFVGTQETSVPLGRFGYYHATPLVSRSILNCFMPVGYILTLYSQADPNTMYPGTTWVRMANTFLWGCDADGDIGITGGEKTHTLTANEIPAHTHGSVYSGNTSGTKTHAWLASGGSSMGYGTVSTGGGQAHNNMPPYTQVAIWRRTA